jgi:hypothetical protein
MMKNVNATPQAVQGARFSRGTSFFRPTAMSVALADAGIIPGTHIVKDKAIECVVRQRNDTNNERASRKVLF